MKLSKTLFLSALLALCSLSYGQKLEAPLVKWGNEFNAPKRSSLNDIVGFDNSGIYAVKERYAFGGVTKYTLEHYDRENFNPTKSFDLDLQEEGRECYVEKILQLKGKLYLFSSFPNSKTK